MKTERQMAEQVFQIFRNTKCRENQGFVVNVLNEQLVYKLQNPKDQETFKIVYEGLQALEYISVDDKNFIRLTPKGYDYIYDDKLVNKMNNIPWIIPIRENTNWIAAWNNLWDVIGPRNEQFYQSGPAFLMLIRKIDNSIETDYNRYMETRRNKRLSTSRKDYFRDLIESFDEDKRYKLYVKLQESFENSIYTTTINDNTSVFEDIYSLFDKSKQIVINSKTTEKTDEYHPKVFISYSWDSEEHKEWVLNLATKLCENGINVILDQWEISNKGGSLIPNFMIKSVTEAQRVLCIMTPNYKKKTDQLEGGVGFEYSILSSETANDLKTTKFIPILRNGDEQQSTPILLNQRIRYYMRDEDDFDSSFQLLLRDLYNEPIVVKPSLGKKPKFD